MCIRDSHIGAAHLADQEHGAGDLGHKVQLFGTDVDIAQQDVVRDNIFDKGGLIVLFLVVGLGAVEGHRRHGTHHLRQLVLPPRKGGVVELGAPARQGLEGIAGILHRLCIGAVDDFHRPGPLFPDTGCLLYTSRCV